MAKTGIVYHPLYLEHKTGSHPECPDRLREVISLLEKMEVLNKLVNIKPRPAQKEEIQLIHLPFYIDEVEKYIKQQGRGHLDGDTVFSEKSYDAAVFAVGGVLQAIDEIMSEKIKNAFCLVRPPGHHAEKERAQGFCIFNNIAITAKYAQKYHNLKKVLIVDWDLHHGNGTQNAFYEDDSILFFSTHQYPHYPGTGGAKEIGRGKGDGYTINVPLIAGCGDKTYKMIFEEILVPIARQFGPDIILVSAGFDAHHKDPLGGENLSCSGYAKLAEIVKSLADELCEGKLLFTLEGGYNLKALSYSILAVFKVIADLDVSINEPFIVPEEKNLDFVKHRIIEVKDNLKKWWKF